MTRLVKPYKRLRRDDLGTYPGDFLVVYERVEYERFYDRASGRDLVYKYEHRIFVDLWLVKVRLNWIGRKNAEAEKLRQREESQSVDSGTPDAHGGSNRQPQ